MAKVCTVCNHPQRNEVDKALVNGESLRMIGKRFDISYSSVNRHKEHIPGALAKAQKAIEVFKGDDLLREVMELQSRATAILDKAELAGDLPTALRAIREAKGCLELLAKMQGELQQEGTTNIHIHPSWVEIRTTILQALTPYPEARVMLAEVLSND